MYSENEINLILSSCDSMIREWVSYYEQDPDQREDNVQELRIKLWKAVKDKYNPDRGKLYHFCFGVIRQEAKKFVLDAHKYKQNHFENDMIPIYGEHSTTDPYKSYESDFQDFKREFGSCLTVSQWNLFQQVCDVCDDENSLYTYSGKVKLNKLSDGWSSRKFNVVFKHFRKKLFEFAKANNMMVNLSTSDAGV